MQNHRTVKSHLSFMGLGLGLTKSLFHQHVIRKLWNLSKSYVQQFFYFYNFSGLFFVEAVTNPFLHSVLPIPVREAIYLPILSYLPILNTCDLARGLSRWCQLKQSDWNIRGRREKRHQRRHKRATFTSTNQSLQ